MNVFEYDDYLVYLTDCLKLNKHLRGFHAQLAKAGGMHPSYLSRILHESIHLTPDQGAGLCNFWNFTREESNYFLNLVHFARAGSPKLKEILKAEIQAAQKKHDDLGNRLPAEKMEVNTENIYYSAWYFGAVHVLLTIPSMQTEFAISEKLNLPSSQVRRILETLEKLELIKKNKNKWEPTKNNIHLNNDSWMASVHHANWRSKIVDRLQFKNPDDIHYTGIHTLSRQDFRKIKEQLLELLVKIDNQIRPSKEEELCCLLLDWSVL